MAEQNKADENRRKLYHALSEHVENLGSYEKFNERMDDEGNRRKVYDVARQYIGNMDTWETFNKRVSPAETYNVVNVKDTDHSADGVAAEPQQNEPAQKPWKPTVQDRIRIQEDLRRVSGSFNKKTKAQSEQIKKTIAPLTKEGRRKLANAERQVRMTGQKTQVSPGSGIGVLDRSPKPYDMKYDKNGKPVVEWLLADGNTTTDMNVARAYDEEAKRQWRQDEFVKRMEANGLDVSNPDHVKTQAAIDAVHSGNYISADERLEILNEITGMGLNPRNQEHIKWVLTGNERKIIQYRLQRAQDNLKELYRQRERKYEEAEKRKEEEKPGFLDMLLHPSRYGASNKFSHGAGQITSPSASVTGATQSQEDIDIENATAEVVALQNALREYNQKVSATGKGWLGKIAQGVWDGITDPNTLTAGFLDLSVNHTARKHKSAQLINSIKHAENLKAQAPDPGGFYSGGRFAGEMFGDPITYVSGGAGKAVSSGVKRAITGGAAKKLGGNVAERLAMNSLGGRMISGAAGSGANMFAFEGLRDMRQQIIDGGWTDENGKFHEGFSWGHALSQGGHGLMLGSVMGVFGAGVGNAGDWMVGKVARSTASNGVKAAGETAIRGAQHATSFVGEGTIFAMPDIYEFQTMDAERFDELYADKYGYADKKGEDRIKARDAARNSLSIDAWSESQAMVFGMKVSGGMMHPKKIISDVSERLNTLKEQGERDHTTFHERVRKIMERSHFDVALTKEEKAEMKQAGYGRLSEIFTKDKADPNTKNRPLDDSGKIILEDAGFDYYSEMGRFMNDRTISQAARAKAYFMLTGHTLPMSTVTGYTTIKGEDGSVTVNSVAADGEVITSRKFSSEAKAQGEINNIMRQAELNSVDMGEHYKADEVRRTAIQQACEEIAEQNPDWTVEGLRKAYEQAKKDMLDPVAAKEIGEGTLKMVQAVDEAAGKKLEELEGETPDAIRERINKAREVDIDEALRKERGKRTEAEQEAIDEYLKELYPEDMGKEDASEPTPQPAEGNDGSPAQALSGGADTPPAEPAPIGRATMKYKDRQVEVLHGRVVMTDDGIMVDRELSDKTIIIRDVATGKKEMVAPEAILSYEDYPAPEDSAGDQTGMETVGYGRGFIRLRNIDGIELRGYLTGEIDEAGRYEYLLEGEQVPRYATKQELDGMVTDYQADEEPAAEAPMEINYERGDTFKVAIDGSEEIQQAGVVDHDGETVTIWTPMPIRGNSEKSRTMSGYTTEIPRNELDAIVARGEDGKPIDYVPAKAEETEAEGSPEERVIKDGISGTAEGLKEGFAAERETIGNEWLDNQAVQDAMRGYAEGALSAEEIVERAKADSADERTRQRLDTLLEFESTKKKLDGEAEAEGMAENRENPARSVPNPASPVEDGQETPAPTAEATALERLPRDAKGEPVFEQAESPEHGWDALVEFAEGDAVTAKEIADTMAEEKRKAYEKAQKQKPKGKTPTEILASKKAISAGLAQAEQEYNLWQQMANVEQRRQDAIRAQQEAEARQRAAERAEAEKAERVAREEAARLEREALEGIPEWHLDTPENARKRGVRRFSGQMFTRQEPVQGVVGKEVEVKFSQKDLPKGRLAVIEAEQLQPSHIQGQRNPMFFIEEAQPKNRAEDVSVQSARDIAEGIRPEEVTGSVTAYTGAPTVNSRGEVIQGNSRSDALRYLWDNKLPEQQQRYKQYLIDNAEKFGLDPEAVKAMERPVLVNMLDVDDAEAIRLGQMTAQDTESGGNERILAKNVAQKMKGEMRTFANMLLSGDEDATFGQLVDRNGADVLKWMAERGYITSTQHKSAYDSKGNLTAEVKNDLQKVLYQSIFSGGSQQLEEMFDKLPAKAQRALLSTAFRDLDSPEAGKMLHEIQASIVAYNELMNEPTFAEAKKLEEVLRAIETFKKVIALDDRFEQYMPSDNFSNFALRLAGLYKASDMSQKTIAGYFNQMYDLAQGKKAGDLFEGPDTREYPLAEVVKKVLDIEYEPAKNGNNNDRTRNNALVGSDIHGEERQRRDGELPEGGEQNPAGTEPAASGAGTSDDSRARREVVQDNTPEEKKITYYDPRTMPEEERARRGDLLRNAEAIEVEPGQIVATKEMSARKAAEKWWDENVAEPAFYDTEVGEVEINKNSVESSLAHKYGQMKLDAITTLIDGFENAVYLGTMPDSRERGIVDHYFAYPISYKGKRCYVFCRAMQDANKNRLYVHEVFVADRITKGDTLQTAASKPHGGIALYRDILANVLEPSEKSTSSEGGSSSISHADESAPAISLESRGDVNFRKTVAKTEPQQSNNAVSSDSSLSTDEQSGTSSIEPNGESTVPERKVNNSASEKQESGAESSVQAADNEINAEEKPIQGLEGYSRDEIKEIVQREVEEALNEADIDAEITGIEIHGSRNRGDAREDSDLDVVVEYSGDMKEYGMFNAIAERPISIEGIKVDVNPIRKEESGTLAEYMERSRAYDKEKAETAAKIASAEAEVNTEPSEAQKKAGNYKMGHVEIDGLQISIENPKGSVRSGKDADGKAWETEMKNTYGYIKGTTGVDGDKIDVFLSDSPTEGDVYVVDQYNKDGSFDEHKVMYGFRSATEAEGAYLSNYSAGWAKGRKIVVTGVSREEFKKWLDASGRKTKPFAEYKSVKTIEGEGGTEAAAKTAAAGDEKAKKYETIEERDREINGKIFEETGIAEGQTWKGPDGTEVRIRARGFVKGPRGWDFATTVTHPDGRKETTLTPAKRIAEYFREKGYKLNETKFSIGNGATEGRAVYETAKGMLESAGIPVIEVNGQEAQAMLEQKNTPFAGLPNRANEKQPSGSVLAAHNGDSSSNATDSRKAEAKIDNNTRSAKTKIKKFKNGDFDGNYSTLYKALSAMGSLLSMRNRGGSRYTILRTDKGDTVAIRLSDHRANGNNFGRDVSDRNLSVVIERKRYDVPDSEIEFTEAVIPQRVFETQPKEVVSAIVNGVDDVLADKPFTLDGSLGSVIEHHGNDVRFHIRTYHGTGAEFDRFDFRYIGNGEGAQAYGWGGYVTEVKGIGKGYATAIGGKELLPKIKKISGNIRQVRQWLSKNGDYSKYARSAGKHLGELQREYRAAEKAGDEKDMEFYRGLIELQEQSLVPENHASLISDKYGQIAEYQKELDGLNTELAQKRHLYTVRIPDDTGGNYLDWDGKIPEDIRNRIVLQATLEGVSLDFYGDSVTAAEYFSKMGENATGFQLYRTLTRALGSDRMASELLSRAGLTGIKYAADHNNGGRADGKKNYVLFNDADMKITNHVQFMNDRNGNVYGWTVGGKVYLNRDAMNPETPLHEYTHLWDEMVRKENPQLWTRGKELLRETPLWDEVMNDPNYQNIRDYEDAVASEVHSRLTGRDGARLLEDMIDHAKGKGVFETAKAITLVENLKRWLSDMFKSLKKTLGKWSKRELGNLTAEDFVKMTIRDLAEGMNPQAEIGRGENARAEVSVDEVAWISEDEGQMGKAVEKGKGDKEMANERGRKYRKTQTGMSLFDWADKEERRKHKAEKPDEKALAAESADAAIDEYAKTYKEYLEEAARLEKGLAEARANEEEAAAIREQLEASEGLAVEARGRLRESLKEYYVRENVPEDAERIARDMVGRVEAEVDVFLRKEQILQDILDKDAPIKESAESVEAEDKRVKTGGGHISYNAMGHLPDAKEGEFAYVERQFSRSGEFSFTGNEVIKDRGDVAYMFRALEDYSIEHVFAVYVKDGKARILHIGMGGPAASFANMGAIRAGYDAFGADKIYLVHNHPSGNLEASIPDMQLMKTLEEAFKGEVETEGIIIDTTSGRYSVFDSRRMTDKAERAREGGETAAEVMRFDRAERHGEAEEPTVVRMSEDVARYVAERRLGTGDKLSYVVLAHNNEIVGNFHSEYGSLEAEGLAEEMASVATKFGGTSVIVYGNAGLEGASRLGTDVSRLSLKGVKLLDAMEITNGLSRSALDEGLMRESGGVYGAEAREPMMSSRAEFEAMRERAEAERGIVMPGLNERDVRVVDVPRHDFSGTGRQAIEKARAWSVQHLSGEHWYHEGKADGFRYNIDKDAIDKYLSSSSTKGSDNLGVHLAALKSLPEIIDNSVEAEIHADYAKTGGKRMAENGVRNPDALIHRYYGAARIDGKPYRIKTTIKETSGGDVAPYNYQVTELELLISGSETSDALSNPNRLDAAKLLKGVEKSYESGKKLLEESKKSGADDILYRTSGEIDAEYPNWLEGTTTESGRHTTQVEGTRKTYSKLGDWIEANLGKGASILDASSGMGYGTADLRERGFNIEDVEPYQSEERKAKNPATYDSYSKIGKEYDYIISNAVLNVIPDNWRRDVLHDMAGRLKAGGRIFINTRKAGEENSIKDKIELDSPQEVLVKRNGKISSYQKFFTPKELKEWVESELGGEYTVEIANERNSGTRGLAAVVVTKSNARQQEMAMTSPEAKRSYAEKLAKKFNTPIMIVEDMELVPEGLRDKKGGYDVKTGKVVVVLANNANVEDVAETVFHEVVAHKGLREMLGEENYDAFCDEVYEHLKDDLKEEVDRETTRRFEREPEKCYEHARRVAVDELFGRMAEKGFEDFTKAERGIWAKLKAKVLEAINKFLGTLRLPKWVRLGDNELRYMLWRSHEKLRSSGSAPNEPSGMDYVDMARDVVKREELGLNRNDAYRVVNPKRERIEKLRRSETVTVTDEMIPDGVDLGDRKAVKSALKERVRGTVVNEDSGESISIFKDGINEVTSHGMTDPAHVKSLFAIPEMLRKSIYIDERRNEKGHTDFDTYQYYVCGMKIDGEDYTAKIVVGVKGSERYYDHRLTQIEKGRLIDSLNGLSNSGAEDESPSRRGPETGSTSSEYKGTTLETLLQVNEAESDYRFRDSDGETGDIWKDRSVGLEERTTNAKIRLSEKQRGDLMLRNEAEKKVIDNLQSLLHEMRNRRGTTQKFSGADHKTEVEVDKAFKAQAKFDRATVKRVSDLARILMQNGYLSGMSSGEIQRLLSAVKDATGMHDIGDSVQKIMDIMVGNQLRNAEGALRQLLSIRGSKVDARGVEVQGVLDVEGQRTMEVVKKAMSLTEDDINDRIAEALNRMSDPAQTIADQAALEYAGLNMALDYVQNIAGSKSEEKTLRDSLKTAKEDRDAGRMTDDAYKQFVEATEDAIRKNKVERAEAYFNLVGRLSDSLRESIENAKAFREAEKARVSEIHHNANSDMEGRPTNEHHKDDWKDKFANNGFVQFLFAPLGTFDQILRVFGNKSVNGEGYLWNRFMRGWVDCRNKELTGVKEKFARLDEKAAELFGKGKTWGNLIRMEAKMPKATVSFWDGGEMRDHELTQGNLLYIYMVDKMTDGRMKLRRMGITESDIAKIENFLDPRFKALGDWLQDEFLVDTRNEYNDTHKRMFGASMAAIENYFPLKILANARVDKEEDVNQQNRPDGITTKTGSIIKRRVNNLALDITGADALSVILDHITQMEHWSAYAEWNRDLNTLRTYKRFRNQVINMTTVYGGGRKLWENFNDLCLMAAGEYRPPVSKLNKSAVNLAKGVTAAKVSFRMYTALKQLLSAPAYAPEVSTRAILKSIANPYGDFKWCLENMPIFRERWHSRISGDPRLLKSDMDWKMWRSRIMELSSRIGMTPNAFVDAVTVSIGARAMYETRLKQYLKEGYPTDAAEKRAMQDATILFNQTQQSSESPFLSTMQVDKDWLSTLFTVFRNSSMSYTRQEFDAMRNLKRNLTPGQRAKSIEFMTKQILRDWDVDPDTATDAERDQAQGAAKKRFRKQIKKDVLRLATFGFILELAWNLGPYLPYIIFGNDEDEKDKMWEDAMTHAYFGSVEGLTGGDVMSSFGNMWASGEWNWNQLSKDMPLASDINTIATKFIGGKNAEAVNDILNLLVQMGVGMNPQSITDTAIAITDACGDDPALSHEAAIFIMRVLQVPQSQIDKLYFDEVDLTGEEASKLTPAQLAQRYAEYKVKRGTPLAPWSWGDEERLGKYNDLAADRMKERLDAQGDATVIEVYADFEARYKAVSEKAKEAKELMKTDYAAAAQAHAALQQDPDFILYQRFGSLDKQLGRISKMWLTSKSPAEAALVASTISSYRAGMVKVLQAETVESQQSAMSELTTLMNDFYAKYQGMQPKQVNR